MVCVVRAGRSSSANVKFTYVGELRPWLYGFWVHVPTAIDYRKKGFQIWNPFLFIGLKGEWRSTAEPQLNHYFHHKETQRHDIRTVEQNLVDIRAQRIKKPRFRKPTKTSNP